MEKTEDPILPYTAPTVPSSFPTTIETRPNRTRSEITIFAGEFIGTFMFLFLAFAGTQIAITSATINLDVNQEVNRVQEVSMLLYISFAFGAALAVNVSIFADVSGAMFNPAVTTGLLLVGAIKWHRALHVITAQLLAGILSAFLVSALLPGPLLVFTVLEPSMSFIRGLFLELFLTAQLVFTILQMPSGPTKPAAIGLTLFVSELCSVLYTGGSLNPARSFGPAVVVGFTREHCIYWVGPLLGGALAAGIHRTLSVIRPVVENVTGVEAK